ncbi:MAG: signal peptidase I [Thermoleophilia bacterium]|nr:signal peptidase I [Thermoleophilia bacterium]
MENGDVIAIDLTTSLFGLALAVLYIVGMWRIFTKAGQPGWAAIIPIYNVYVWLKVAGRPGWWLLLWLIPFVNFIVALLVSLDIAKSFGKGSGFGVGLWLLAPIFVLILGFGSAQYEGPAAAPA